MRFPHENAYEMIMILLVSAKQNKNVEFGVIVGNKCLQIFEIASRLLANIILLDGYCNWGLPFCSESWLSQQIQITDMYRTIILSLKPTLATWYPFANNIKGFDCALKFKWKTQIIILCSQCICLILHNMIYRVIVCITIILLKNCILS